MEQRRFDEMAKIRRMRKNRSQLKRIQEATEVYQNMLDMAQKTTLEKKWHYYCVQFSRGM